MQQLLNDIFNNDYIDIYSFSDRYYNIRTPFTGLYFQEITYESWKYSISHLPVSIFMTTKKPIHYILHTPDNHFYTEDNVQTNYTFNSWEVYGGEIHMCAIESDANECIIHINLRDLYTDVLEFISNLILHIKFMQLHNNDSILVCNNNNCSTYGDCTVDLISKQNVCKHQNQKSSIINLKNAPQYNVTFDIIDINKGKLFMTTKFNAIYSQILSMILAFCNNPENLKIHVINGATTQFCLMTTKHPGNINLSTITLNNTYGGKYKNYDEYLAKLLKSRGGLIWNEINENSAEWYKYCIIDRTSFSIINLNKVKISECMDPIFIELINSIKEGENHVILNIPYSFGSESYFIAQALQNIFGEKLCSFQIIGKAGGIGNGVKLNDYIISNKLSIAYNDVFDIPSSKKTIRITKYKNIDKTLYSGDVNVYESGIKIMPCVLFEQKQYLESIKTDYFAIEMESFWFQYAFNSKLPTVYLYYISDLPLETSLAHENYPRNEGQMLFNGLIRMGLKWINNIINQSTASRSSASRSSASRSSASRSSASK